MGSTIPINVKVVVDAINNASKPLKDIGSSLSGVGDQFDAFKKNAAVAGVGIAAIGVGATKLAQDAAKFQTIQTAFGQMTQGIVADTDVFVKQVKSASANTLSSLDVMQGGTRALSLIGKDSFSDFGKQFTQMAELSKKAAQAQGESVDFMFDSLVRGVGRGSALILDNLGLQIDAETVNAKYAASVGKTAEELTKQEQKTALLNAALTQLQEKYANVTLNTSSAQTQFEQLRVQFAETSRQLGEAMIPLFNQLLTALIPLVQEYGPMLIALISNAVAQFTAADPWLQKLIIGFVALLPAMVAIGVVLTPLIATFAAFGNILGITITIITSLVAILGGPLTIAIVAISVLVAAFAYAWKHNWMGIQEKTAAVVDWVRNNAVPLIQTALNLLSGNIIAAAATWIGRFDAVRGVINGVKDALGALISKAREMASAVSGGLKIPGFATGGVVPGPIGAAQLAVVHGGERIIPTSGGGGGGEGGGGISFSVHVGMYAGSATEKRNIAESLFAELVNLASARNKSVSELLATG